MQMIFEGDPQGKEEIGTTIVDTDYATFERIVDDYKKELQEREDNEIRTVAVIQTTCFG